MLGERTLPKWEVRLSTSPIPAAQFPGCAVGARFQVCHVSPLGSQSLPATLLAAVNHPGSQEDVVSNWEPAHSLVKNAVSGAKIVPRFLALDAACLPLCHQWGEGPVLSLLALLWY